MNTLVKSLASWHCSSGRSRGQLGSPENPMHMNISGKIPTFKSELWSLLRLVVGIIIISSVLSSTLFNSVKNSSKEITFLPPISLH